MKSIIKLFLKRQFKTGGFLASVLLTLVMLMFFPSLTEIYSAQTAAAIIGTGITMTIIVGWGSVFSKIKTSSILKGIQTSNFTKGKFILISSIPAMIMFVVSSTIFISAMFIFIASGNIVIYTGGYITNPPKLETFSLKEFLFIINWWHYFAAILLTFISSISVAYFIVSVTTDSVQYTTIAWIYMIVVFFFGGATVPIPLIRGTTSIENPTQEMFKYIGYALPGVYNNFLMVDILSTFNTNISSKISTFEKIQNIWIPMIFNVTLIGVASFNVRYWK